MREEVAHLEFVEIAASAVRDFDLLFALVFSNKPLEGAVTNALHNVSRVQHFGGFYPRGSSITVTCWATESSMVRGMMLLNYVEPVRLLPNMCWSAQLLHPIELLPVPAGAPVSAPQSQYRDVGCVLRQACCATASMARVQGVQRRRWVECAA